MADFELLNPRGLWLLAGAIPLVVLYILKVQRRPRKVPSTWLWASSQRDLLAKQPFKRLVAELPLLLQLLALIVLALALARPAVRGSTLVGDHVAIVVDTSASMGTSVAESAGHHGKTRMDQARQAAEDAILALSPGADAIVIDAGREARVLCPLDRDLRHLRAAIATLQVREVEGDLAPAIALAADRLRTLSGKKRLLVITDGALAHPGDLAASGVDTQILTVGDPRDNAGLVRIDVRSGTDPSTKREQAQVFVMIKNYADKPKDAYVSLAIEGSSEPVTSRRVLLPADDKMPVVLTFSPAPADAGKGLLVHLAPGDAFPLDDDAYGRVPAGHRMPVTVASREAYSWTLRALESDPDIDLQRVTPEQLTTVNVDPDSLVVVLGACPDAPPGHDLFVVAPPPGRCLGVDVGATVVQPQLTSWEASDPRFRFLTLDGVHVARGARLEAPGAGASLLRAGSVTLMADASVPGRTATLLGFDPGDSDWPLKASFVLFVRNVLELARIHRASGTGGPVRTGDALRIAVPPGTLSVRTDGPGVTDAELTAKGGFAVMPSAPRAGFYHVRWGAPHVGGTLIAANLTSELESDVRPRPVALHAGDGVTGATAGRIADAHQEWNAWLALGAALLVALDLFWLTRKPPTSAALREASARARRRPA